MFDGRASHRGEDTMLTTDPGLRHQGALRALVLHGDAAARSQLQRALEARGMVATVAADGAAGVDRLLAELLWLDVLVVDLDLPGRDGRALAALVRQAGNEQELALVVVAARTTQALRLELGGLGVDAVVDRSEGSETVAAAAIAAVRRRRQAAEIDQETWREAPAAAPLGETTWSSPVCGGVALVA
jgi:DNA-binding response OmpR family regulator